MRMFRLRNRRDELVPVSLEYCMVVPELTMIGANMTIVGRLHENRVKISRLPVVYAPCSANW